MQQVINPNEDTNSWFHTVIKVVGYTIGLVTVILCVMAATHYKFSVLRSATDSNGQYVTVAEKTKQLDCLTRNVYWEAAHESFEGKVAVAQVTMNRVDAGKFAPTVCGVVYQKNIFYEKVVCQFSWFCEANHKTKPINKLMWTESEEVAKKVLLENFRLPGLKTALFYHADYINPGGIKPRFAKIGEHIFKPERSKV